MAIGSYPYSHAHLQLLLFFARACAFAWRYLSRALSEAEVLAAVAGILLCCTSGSFLLTCEPFPGSGRQLLQALASNWYEWYGWRFPFPSNSSFGKGLLIES